MTQEEARELHIMLLSLAGIFHEKFLFYFRKCNNFPPEVKKNLFKIINILYEFNSMTPTAIGKMLDIEKGSLTTMIDQLEGMGFVVRGADSKDRRKLLLSLSENGREQMDKIMDEYTKSLVDLFEDIDPEDFKHCIDSFRYVVAFLKGI